MAQQPRDYVKPALWIMGAILVIGAGIGAHNQWERVEAKVIALIPDTVDGYELQRFNLIHERRKDLLSGVGTVATIAGGVGLFLNLRLAERRLTLDTQKIQQDAKQTETRLTSERFSKATEQLSHESIHVRLGGIYSLEQIAKDSPEDHWTVMEVLSAFIREESAAAETSGEKGTEPSRLRTDIQAALTVIGRREKRDEPSDIDLSRTDLRAADLHGTNFRSADFCGAQLCQINFRKADLYGANFSETDLREANLAEANLVQVNFLKANLGKAQLWKSDLTKAFFGLANIAQANFARANLSGSNFHSARNFNEANLHEAKIKEIIMPHDHISNH